ncbi:MAG: hypothetical protein ACO396_09795 [Phycisphaerales bacterium]
MTTSMGIVLPVALVVLVFAAIGLARRPQRPPLVLVVTVQVLTLVVGFGFGFTLAGVESSYLRSGLEGLVKKTAETLESEGEGCERVRKAYADGLVAIEEGVEGIGLQSRLWRSLERGDQAPKASEPGEAPGSTVP